MKFILQRLLNVYYYRYIVVYKFLKNFMTYIVLKCILFLVLLSGRVNYIVKYIIFTEINNKERHLVSKMSQSLCVRYFKLNIYGWCFL